jgi:uncharacterized protein (TIGR02145 family)
MKRCPVCSTQAEDLYTGHCHNPDCTWEFEFIGAEPKAEMQFRYTEKLKLARVAFSRIHQVVHDDYYADPRDGRKYKTVKIGNQIWMAENLNVDRFRNGDSIPEAGTNEEWKSAGEKKQPAWCYYDNDPAQGSKYGKLYNWYAVNYKRGLAPKGWHVPSNGNYETLLSTIGYQENPITDRGSSFNILIDGGSCGFNALIGGYRFEDGCFRNHSSSLQLWSSTEEKFILTAWYLEFCKLKPYYHVYLSNILGKEAGFYARCVIEF